jgi:hypothetical protein
MMHGFITQIRLQECQHIWQNAEILNALLAFILTALHVMLQVGGQIMFISEIHRYLILCYGYGISCVL